MKNLLTNPDSWSGFGKPFGIMQYALLQGLLVAAGLDADTYGMLKPSCDGTRLAQEPRKRELVGLLIDFLNAGVDPTAYFDPLACDFSYYNEIAPIVVGGLGLRMSFIDTPIGTTGNRTINSLSGTIVVAAGSPTVALTNNNIGAGTQVHAVILTNDATFNAIDSIVIAGSVATIRGPANATAATKIGWFLVNPVTPP